MAAVRPALAAIVLCALLASVSTGSSHGIPRTVRNIYVERLDFVSTDVRDQMLNDIEAAHSKKRTPCFNVVSDRRHADAILVAESKWDAEFVRRGDLIWADVWLSNANDMSTIWRESSVPLRSDRRAGQTHVTTTNLLRDLYRAARCSADGRLRIW
jgi:hypothetical protein